MDAHATWNPGTQRAAVCGVQAALNHAVEYERLGENPLKGFWPGKQRARVTYFTEEVEQAFYRHASPEFALALRVLIETGARPGEFCALTAEHVKEDEQTNRQAWVLREHKTAYKKGEDRRIVPPREIAELVRQRMKDLPKGAQIFTRANGTRWTTRRLEGQLSIIRAKLAEEGIELDPDDCLYTTRHTFAKRKLGAGCSLEQVAGLMGNAPSVCCRHYAKWCPKNTDPLYEAMEW